MNDALDRGREVAEAAQLACLLEVSAPKPGNVSPGRHFPDARYEDFLASAVAIGDPLSTAGMRPVGATVRLAIDATARWTRSNTNLGIVLLLAPLARAAMFEQGAMPASREDDGPFFLRLRRRVADVLRATTVDDAREVYRAIRRASPGGLGRVESQDVADEPSLPLVDVMRLAADRDGIAREYAEAFEITFDHGVPALEAARRAGLTWDDAVLETFLTLLAGWPDTHMARQGGEAHAMDISRRARAAQDAGGVRTEAGRCAIDGLDHQLRERPHAGNPGTTADLTAAAIFVVLLGGGWTDRRDVNDA